ncbi:MAG: hypothetical protein H6736_11640 [Alphaproteobacteria bacterium]|nr:hypothetical protein [Alphaproteobacteria bacterium]MCB9692455.1 hypothetical protein [Alphaproteobacteria bacterium]
MIVPFVEALRAEVAKTPWIVAVDAAAFGCRMARSLLDLGAPDVLVVACTPGAGELDPTIRTVYTADVRAEGMMQGLRAAEAALDALSDDVVAAIDAWDPERQARVWRAFFSTGGPVAGRPTFGARPAAWQALEDKTVIDAVLEAAGLQVAPWRVVPVERDAVQAAREALDRGDGVVLAGDTRAGFNGGASYVRWCVTDAELDAALAFFARDCDRLRVMPFLEGLPCSIHAFVMDDGVAVFRPCEMLVFREGRTFRYAAAASSWECPEPARTGMRTAVRRVAEHLSSTLGYRGMFTLDGVLKVDGFLPTELNPRVGAAFAMLVDGMGLDHQTLHFAAIEGVPLGGTPQELEDAVLAWSADHRAGRAGLVVPTRPAEQVVLHLADRDGGLVDVPPEEAGVVVTFGPTMAGGYLNVRCTPEALPVGPPLAPLMAGWLRTIGARLDIDLGDLRAAQPPG